MPRTEALLKGKQRGTPAVEQDRRGRVHPVSEEARTGLLLRLRREEPGVPAISERCRRQERARHVRSLQHP